MLAHTHTHLSLTQITETELFARIQLELVNRYSIDGKLASEMAWDFMEVLTAVNSDIEIFEKYFLH